MVLVIKRQEANQVQRPQRYIDADKGRLESSADVEMSEEVLGLKNGT